jgi:ribose transport system substrate-binding protein
MTSGLGVFSALGRQDLAVPKGNDDHIVHTQLDGGPDVNPKVGDGLIDLAVDQPNYYYIPLAMKQMEDWWEDGDDALPEPGTELTEEDYPFETATYMQGATETELFLEPIWAPAQVQEANGHINVQTAGITITEDNYDAPYHWGNIWG